MNPLTNLIGKQQKKKKKKIKGGVVLGKNLGQIRSNVVKKVKKRALSTVFLIHFTLGIPFNAKRSGCTNTSVKISGKYS